MGRTYQVAGAVNFMVDPARADLAPGRQIDWANVPTSYAGRDAEITDHTITVNQGTPPAQDDTTIDVAALPVALDAETVLDFGEHTDGHQQLAKLSADAEQGATQLTVYPLSGAIEDAATATYTVIEGAAATKQIPAGTIMAALSSGKMIPRAAVTGAETAVGILVGDAVEGAKWAALNGYGLYIGGGVYTNLLPDSNHGDFGSWQDELNAAGVGHFTWHTYADNTTS